MDYELEKYSQQLDFDLELVLGEGGVYLLE